MTIYTICLMSLLTSTSAALLDGEDPAASNPRAAIQGMDWMAGTWSGAMWGGTFTAYYTTPEGGKLLSHSALHREGKQAFYEFELFEIRGQHVVLQPFPRGKQVTPLTLASHDPKNRIATFENPDKDYPTRIVYQRVSDDTLVITLTDPHGGTKKKEQFELRRVETADDGAKSPG